MNAPDVVFLLVCPGLVGRCIGRLARVSLWTTTLAYAEKSRIHWHGLGGDGRAHLTPIGLARTLLRPRGLEVFLVEHEGVCRGVAVEREAPRG